MDGLMARNPYRKRAAQGAAQGAMGGATAGFMATGTPFGAIAGGLGGGVAGALLARPGEDERQLRARMRRLERGVLGDEEAAIMGRFVDPVAATANEQLVRSRAVTPAVAATGAQAREAVAGQRAARGDISQAAQEGALAVMDLGEQRRTAAQRIREGLVGQGARRDMAFRRSMLEGGLDAASMLGSTRALKDLKAEEERRRLSNAADIEALDAAADEIQFQPGGLERAAISDEDVASLQLGGGVAPSRQELEAGMAATRAALDARAVQPPVTDENVDDYLMSRTVPGDAMTPTLMGRGGSIGSGAAVQTLDDVGVMADVPLGFREQRDIDRSGDIGFLFGDDAQLSLLSGNDPDGILSMPESEYKEYINNANKQKRFGERTNILRDSGIDVSSVFDEDMQKFVFDGSDDEFMDFSDSLQMMPTGFFVRMGG